MNNILPYLRSAACFICLMAACVVAVAQTQAASPETGATPQPSPTPAQVPPEINAILVEINNQVRAAQGLLDAGQKMSVKSGADSLAARAKLNEALTLFRSLREKLRDKNLLDKVSQSGATASQSLNLLKIFEFFSRTGEALSFDAIAQTHTNLSERLESINATKEALKLYQEIISDKSFQNISGIDFKKNVLSLKFNYAAGLGKVGHDLDKYFGKLGEGIKYLTEAIEGYQSLYREEPNPQIKLQEARTLIFIATIYGRESKSNDKAVEFLTKALEIFRSLPGADEETASSLSMIATRQSLGYDYKRALENWEQALAIYQKINDKKGESNVLRQIALMYWVLNNKPKVVEYSNLSLGVLQSADFAESWRKRFDTKGMGVFDELYDALIEHTRLDSIAFVYRMLEDYQKSLEYYEKSLAVAPRLKDLPTIRFDLRSTGYTLAKLERWEKASGFYKQALAISRKSGSREEIADDLQDVGWTLMEAGKPAEALQYQNEALSIYQSVEVDENRAFSVSYSSLLNEISRSYFGLGNRRLAIFYGKRGVNAIQGERQKLQNLDPVAQKGFLENKAKHYRRLADWLIAEGRLPEAEQILAMLKEDEYFRYVRGNASTADPISQRANLNAAETAALKRYNEISYRLVELGAQYSSLEEKRKSLPESMSLSPPEAKRLDELTELIAEAAEGFQVFLRQLAEEFSRTTKAVKVKEETQQNKGLRSDLKDWRTRFGDEGVVAVYTILGEERYRVILTTPDVQVDGKTEIKAEALREKIAAFRQAVQNPGLDPRPLGKELYDILVKPIEKQLNDAKAKTLLWSLDDTLRYVPVAALWDGKQYFGQKYQHVVITLASRTRLNDTPDANWRVLGLGVTEPRQVNLAEPDGSTHSLNFNALPAVREELQTIVRDETSSRAETGILPGRRLLDQTFTEAALKESMGRRYKVIHIASHFSFRPGDLANSFLLLGDGQVLRLSKIRSNPQLAFTGVELLTLSACNTAIGEANANGAEVESFGVVAQETGAKAVMATLWSVADESTSLLMSEFYRLRKENPKLTKAEAMQLAQKEMLEGKLRPRSTTSVQRDTVEVTDSKTAAAPQFAFDPQKPYAHPYYWAPFILIGNWR